jgi:hypothetical protein
MPFSPSDLPWWGWLLCSLVAWIVCGIAYGFSENKNGGCLAILLATVAGLGGTVTGIMGIILFVKWVWTS